jgi:hypothetical protein
VEVAVDVGAGFWGLVASLDRFTLILESSPGISS